MSDIAVRFDSVSKKFTLSRNRPRSFQEIFVGLVSPKRDQSNKDSFWVFRNVSLEIPQAQIIGFIGPNGTGKSTLLKLASRIIAPTTGRVEIKGRVAALLELGTGFHPDLTGRENIFLNGSLMGLSQREIHQKLDSIVEFSGLEDFIDSPVRHYSSGMYMRLGFSIVVHVEPRVLLVDEILAVGDILFQQKCLKRVHELKQQGVTILFVSHNLDTMRNICQRVVWMERGEIRADGQAEDVVQKYIRHSYEQRTLEAVSPDEQRRWGTGRITIEDVEFLDQEFTSQQTFSTGKPFTIRIHFHAAQPVKRPIFGLAVYRGDGAHICGPNTRFGRVEIPVAHGRGTVDYTVPALPLLGGVYRVSVSSTNWDDTEMFDFHDRLYPFQVLPSAGERYGIISLQGIWSWRNQTLSS